jgi:NAD+ synthase (glutamine-hydrolysing)
MKDGFIKAATASIETKLCDVYSNGSEVIELIRQADKDHIKLVVFPELTLTGYTAGDLFFQDALIEACEEEVKTIIKESEGLDVFFALGLPVLFRNKLYNVAAVICSGKLLGLVPKLNIPNDHEFYERRQFTPGFYKPLPIKFAGVDTFIGAGQLFKNESLKGLAIGIEICEDLWVACPPSINLAQNGATVIFNLSASNDITGKSTYRRELVKSQSARLYAAYIYASSGAGESTQDLVFSGHCIIASNGRIAAEEHVYEKKLLPAVIDIDALESYRKGSSTFSSKFDHDIRWFDFSLKKEETEITFNISQTPFVPGNLSEREERCREILDIQARGLSSRLKFTGMKKAVIGISGGLDSTLALLVTCRAFDMAHIDRKGIIGVTMPGFGTSGRTYQNAVKLIRLCGATFKEVSIRKAVLQHFSDIDQDPDLTDVTYENSQARERTQILMDLSNKEGGLVIGTGDLSELALGWCTYNGDHMSMYAVNTSVPKTLVRYLVSYEADSLGGKSNDIKEVLVDILDTPVSPELVPGKNGEIAQKTEDIVGPYLLHDFFLYYVVRMGFRPEKVLRLAKYAFKGTFDDGTIEKWLMNFYRRFFSQQFKRSCMPDGPKVGTVSLSPRGDWRMPSDAYRTMFKF